MLKNTWVDSILSNQLRRYMTSFKKLSIAIVAALSLGLLATTPAAANTQTLAIAGTVQNTGSTAATAVALPVVEDAPTASNVLSVSVSGVAAGTTVSAVATNAFLLTTLTGATGASGSATATVNASTSGSVELFVFTKTSNVGSVTVTVGNTTTTYYVKGTAGAIAKVAVSAPSTGLAASTQSVVVSAFDKFDNVKGSGSVNLVINTNGAITTTTVTTGAGGTVSHVVTLPASGSVTVTAFAASSSATATIAVTQPRNLQAELDKALADLAAEQAAHVATKGNLLTVTAQLVALQAKLDSATALSAKDVRKLKWQYNVLVKKYNVGKSKAQKLAFIK
jgi:hypothetical protein